MSQPTRKILLDECIDGRLARHLHPHAVTTVAKAGWAGTRNGQLLRKAESEFDVFITVDRNLSFQQPLLDFDMAVMVLRAPTNRLQDLLPLVPRLLKAMASAGPGRVIEVG